jgi:hypothetical protein
MNPVPLRSYSRNATEIRKKLYSLIRRPGRRQRRNERIYITGDLFFHGRSWVENVEGANELPELNHSVALQVEQVKYLRILIYSLHDRENTRYIKF